MINIFIIVLGILMIASAIYTIRTKRIIFAVLSSGIISLLASVMYIVLAAPDVAMTEAAIGSGLTTIVFLYAFAKIRKGGHND